MWLLRSLLNCKIGKGSNFLAGVRLMNLNGLNVGIMRVSIEDVSWMGAERGLLSMIM